VARCLDPQHVWAALERGEAQLFDPSTELERCRYGGPGAQAVSLDKHVARPGGPGASYLCRHAVRSKATLCRGAAEVAGGFVAWKKAGLPDREDRSGRGGLSAPEGEGSRQPGGDAGEQRRRNDSA
jgi:rhodanese-related sulfurtransferase